MLELLLTRIFSKADRKHNSFFLVFFFTQLKVSPQLSSINPEDHPAQTRAVGTVNINTQEQTAAAS